MDSTYAFSLTGFPAFLAICVVSLLWVVPMWKLLPKHGYSKWLSCLGFLPILGAFATLVLIWVIAFGKNEFAISNQEAVA